MLENEENKKNVYLNNSRNESQNQTHIKSMDAVFDPFEPHSFEVLTEHQMTSLSLTSVCFVEAPIGSMTICSSWGWRALDFVVATSST